MSPPFPLIISLKIKVLCPLARYLYSFNDEVLRCPGVEPSRFVNHERSRFQPRRAFGWNVCPQPCPPLHHFVTVDPCPKPRRRTIKLLLTSNPLPPTSSPWPSRRGP